MKSAKKDILSLYRYDGSRPLDLDEVKCDAGSFGKYKAQIIERTEKNMQEIQEKQNRLYAQGQESILIVLQALDAAGKDSTIKHVMSTIDPQGIDVFSFKSPNDDEAKHDFLWRYHKRLPARGKMCIFNRSYYEEVLVVKVHEFWKGYNMPKRTFHGGKYIENKYKEIVNWEKYLYGNGFRVVKIFLNLSQEEQKKRFLERIERKEKNWKFSANDIAERQYWQKYRAAFQDAVNGTATSACPWYVVPADQKWYTRFVVSEILVECLRSINPKYPSLDEGNAAKLQECRRMLEEEGSAGK